MKKLKTLCAVVGAAAMLYATSAFTAEQKFDVPEYDLKNADKGSVELTTEDGRKVTFEIYTLDRNKDGKIDLGIYNFYLEGKKMLALLYIDDDFDGVADRILKDDVKKDGSYGADGIYDKEEPSSLPLHWGE